MTNIQVDQALMAPPFIHLRLHTEFSIQDGLLTIPALLQKAVDSRMPALGISDLGNLYATIKFYQQARAAGIKPIIGVDLAILDDKKPDSPPTRLTLFCQTNTGYQHLLRLVSSSYLHGQINGSPCIRKSHLVGQTEGLIALSGGQFGDIGEALLAQDKAAAEQYLNDWLRLFPNRFYLEISRVNRANEATYLAAVLHLAHQANVPVVATNDVRFLEKDDFEAHEARVCIQQGVTLTDSARPRHYTDEQYFRSPDEMQRLFSDLPSALANTVEIAKRCNVSFQLGKSLLPHFAVPAELTTENYLSNLAKLGLEKRLSTLFATPEEIAAKRSIYDDRLERELNVINKMGFAGYFLIVADFTKWAKENNIPVGPGRGSGPGSLVAYALNITDLDPMALDLLFERFLNPERISMPDFDIDFCIDGRDRVIDYVMHKHGLDSVSQIITYGTMAAKAVVRDVGRVLGLGYGFVDKIAKLIPFELGITLNKALEQEPQLKERYQQEEEVRTLIDLARKLEGITRNVGKHAGGIVIAPGKLTDFVPLYCEPNETTHPVTQFDKDDVEAVGLVKFDFLGLKTLTIIHRALQTINQSRLTDGLAPIDISLIPLHDPKTFSLLKQCLSTAVFQLESHGMRDLIKRLQPDCFEDLIALVALFRPGPLQAGMVDDFINRKSGHAPVLYPHPKIEPILRSTYGVIVYQEQVMQIAQVLAGYTLGAADILRKAMGKKKPEEMAKQREVFCEGAVQRGVDVQVATAIFDLMEKFAGYGFNKSHSAAYALIAYQTAWLKAHYTAIFMAAVLSSDMDKTDKIIILLADCVTLKLSIQAPDINKSDYYFTALDERTIMYGLGAIKGVGETAIQLIIAARQQGGPFKDLFDFCQRIDSRKVNRRVLEVLIKSGCFDSLGTHRAILMTSLPKALQLAEQALNNQRYGQQDLLGMPQQISHETPLYTFVEPWCEDEQLRGEKETLGFYLTGHPLDQYRHELAHFTTGNLVDLHANEHVTARLAGIITSIRTRQTKRGDRIAICTLDDGTAQIEMVCFSECYAEYRHLLNPDQLVIAEGDISLDEFSNKPRLVCKDLYTLDQTRERFAKTLQIHIHADNPMNLEQLKHCLSPHTGGNCSILIQYLQGPIQASFIFGKTWLIKPSDALTKHLREYMPNHEFSWVY